MNKFMKRILFWLLIITTTVFSLSLVSCGDDEPNEGNQNIKTKLIKGTLTVKNIDRNTTDFYYAALGDIETDEFVNGEYEPVTEGYEGRVCFFTNLFDEETIKEVEDEPSDIANLMLIGSSYIDFYFSLSEGIMKVGNTIEIGGIYWSRIYSLAGDHSDQMGGTVTVKAITNDVVTLKFDNVKFDIQTRFKPGDSDYETIIVNGEISFPQPGTSDC